MSDRIQFKQKSVSGIATYKEITKRSLPVIIMVMLQTMVPLVDNIMVGLIGDDALGALGFSSTLIFSHRIIIMGLVGGASIMLGQYLGSGNLRNVNDAHKLKINLVLVFSLPFVLWMAAFPNSYMQLWTHDSHVIQLGNEYLRWMSIGLIVGVIANQIATSTAQIGKTTMLLVVAIVAVLANVGLDWIFIKVLHAGIKGVAIATIIVQATTFVGLYIYNWVLRTPIHINILLLFQIKKEVISNSFKRWHVLVTEVVFTLSISIAQFIIARAYIDSAGMVGAVRAATGPFTRVAMAGFIGASSTISYFVGTRLGSSRFGEAEENAKRVMIVGLIFLVLLTTSIAISAQWIVEIYTKVSDEVKRQTIWFLRFTPFINFAIGYSALKLRILESGGETKTVMIWDFFYCLFYIGMTAAIAYGIHLEDKYIWLTLVLVNSLRFLKVIYSWYLYRQKKWLRNLTLTIEQKGVSSNEVPDDGEI